MEFQTFKIGDIAKVQGGFAFKSADFKDTGIPVLKITNVQDRRIELNNLSYVDPCITEGLERFFVKTGDVLISLTGNGPHTDTALVGRTARYSGLDNAFILNQRVGRFLVNEDLVRKRFLYYWISRPEINRELALRSTGSANQANISGSTIENFEISIPDLKTQDKILTILGDIDDKIELNNQINETLEAMAKAIFKEWFIDFGPVKAKAEGKKPFGMDDETASLFPDSFEDSELGPIPKGWELKTFGDVSNCFDSKRVPLSGAEREKRKGIYPYYGAASHMGNVDDFLFDGVYALMGEDGSVVNKDGTPVLQYVWGKFWVNNHAHVLTGKDISTEHLLLFLKHTIIAPYVTGAVQPKLNQGNMNRIPFLKATPPVNIAFSKLIEPLFAKVRANNEESESLTQTRDLLLPKLISGELQPSEVNSD